MGYRIHTFYITKSYQYRRVPRNHMRPSPGDGAPVHHSWAKGQRVLRLQVRGPKQWRPARVSVRRCVGGSALVAGRLCVTLGARANGYASGPALTAGHSCDTPGAHCGERSRSQALCQRHWTAVGGDRKRHGGWPVGRLGVRPGWSSRAARIIHRRAGVPKGQGFGHQVQTGASGANRRRQK